MFHLGIVFICPDSSVPHPLLSHSIRLLSFWILLFFIQVNLFPFSLHLYCRFCLMSQCHICFSYTLSIRRSSIFSSEFSMSLFYFGVRANEPKCDKSSWDENERLESMNIPVFTNCRIWKHSCRLRTSVGMAANLSLRFTYTGKIVEDICWPTLY